MCIHILFEQAVCGHNVYKHVNTCVVVVYKYKVHSYIVHQDARRYQHVRLKLLHRPFHLLRRLQYRLGRSHHSSVS